MREIKFRDYDVGTKTMRYFDIDGYDRYEHNCYGNIMQYTGLKDSNGEEIYEGDIVKVEIKNGCRGYNISEYGIVEFQYCCWVYHYIDREGCYDPLYDVAISYELEIIGDIYENPDLINNQ